MITQLPTGEARQTYHAMRAMGQPVAVALAKAAEVQACPDVPEGADGACETCHKPINITEAVIWRRFIVCASCKAAGVARARK